MLDHVGIIKTFRQTLLNVQSPYLPAPDRMAWENVEFSPPEPKLDDANGSRWLREAYTTVSERQVSYGNLELTAIMRYDCHCPAGGGVEELRALVQSIGDAFKPGTGLASTGPNGRPVQISLLRCEPGQGVESAYGGFVWYMIPLRITFRAYGQN